MDIQEELNKAVRQIEALISADRFQEAYTSVNKLLLNFPEYGKLQRLKRKIEKIVYQHNIITVKKDLENIKPLWKEKNYSELVKKLSEIVKYVPGFAQAENELFKAQRFYRDQVIKQQKDTLANYIRAIEKGISDGNYEKSITLCREVLLKIPQHEKCGTLLAKAKHLLIDKKIKENELLLKSEKYDEILKFLNDLNKLCPDSVRVKNLLDQASNREKITLEFQKKDFLFNSFEQITILYQKKKYDKTIEALREMLEIEPDNLKALELLKKAEKNYSSELDKQVILKIKNLKKKFKEEKKKYPKDFIKL